MESMYSERVSGMDTHTFIHAIYQIINNTTKVIKVRCQIINNHYRMCVNNVFSKEYNIPEGTTHIYYDEFIDDDWMSSLADKIIATPIKFEDHMLYFFKADTQKWTLADFGTHIIEDTSYHLIEWCKHDFDHPRLRIMPIGYQVLKYINRMDEYNQDDIAFEECTNGLSRFDVGCYKLFKTTINQEMGNLLEYFKDVESGYDLINTIINIKTDDVEIKKFVDLVSMYQNLLLEIFAFMKKSSFEFKV